MPEITLIAHNIRSTHNVGSIFRTAEGFGVRKIILTGYTPYPKQESDDRLPHIREKITDQIHKTALGAEALVPFEYYDSIDQWLELNREQGNLPLLALEQDIRSISLTNYHPQDKFALLLGEEVHGIESSLLSHCSAILEIPMVGQKESFNVSVATGIALYALTANNSVT